MGDADKRNVLTMLIRKPDYYDKFQCAAGACHDTCCAAWDIVIDEESAAFYNALPGELGERVRAAMTEDEDGDLCFSVAGGHCPLLTEERLCSIQLTLGEERVCDTCRSHPRFIEEYGSFKEMALAASCPAAIELILSGDAVLTEEQDDELEFTCEDVDEELLSALLPCRETAFRLLGREELAWNTRLAALLMFGSELQLALLSGDLDALPELAADWADVDAERLSFAPVDTDSVRTTRRRCLELLGELEVLDENWAKDIAAVEVREDTCPVSEDLERRWACYLLWRWFLRADFDGDIYGKLALPVLSILTLRELSRGEDWQEWARRWAKEVEHSAENLNALYDAVCTEPELAPGRLIGAL